MSYVLMLTSAHTSSSSFDFSRQGLPQRIFHLHSVLSSASSSVTSTTAMSSLTASVIVLLDLYRFLAVPSSASFSPPIYPSSFLQTCPYHLSLASRVFSPNSCTQTDVRLVGLQEQEKAAKELEDKLREDQLAAQRHMEEEKKMEEQRMKELKEHQEKELKEHQEKELKEQQDKELKEHQEKEHGEAMKEQVIVKQEKQESDTAEQEEKLEEERKMKLEEERKAKLEEERKMKLEEERKAKLEEERKMKLEEERKMKLEEERKEQLEEELKTKLEEQRKRKLEQQRAKMAEQRKRKLEEHRKKQLQQKQAIKQECDNEDPLDVVVKKEAVESVKRVQVKTEAMETDNVASRSETSSLQSLTASEAIGLDESSEGDSPVKTTSGATESVKQVRNER